MENWKNIKGYHGLYQVSNLGNVKSFVQKNERIMKLSNNGNGYFFVGLKKEKKTKIFYIHRLVAESFIGVIENKIEVNHINGIKNDNRVENLELVTRSQNIKHSFDFLNRDKRKGVKNDKNSCLKNGNSTIVINSLNNEKYSVISASFFLGMNYSTFKAKMSGQNKNNTIFYPENKSQKYINKNLT